MDFYTQNLLDKINSLEKENAFLAKQLEFNRRFNTLKAGMKGETLVCELIGGKLTTHTAPHDILAKGKIKIEVKFSNLQKCRNTQTRWSWAGVLGLYRGKDFDRLLLIGVGDERYTHLYKDPQSPYVIFDLSYSDVVKLIRKDNILQSSAKPDSAKPGSIRHSLFTYYQVTTSDLKSLYGLDEIEETPTIIKSVKTSKLAVKNTTFSESEKRRRIKEIRTELLLMEEKSKPATWR